MSTSYNGKLARINLSTGEIKVEELDIDKAIKFVGGRGLGTKILCDEGIAKVEPLSAENKLVYLTGPMTGTPVPTGGRYMVVTKSPLTGMIASSNSGGVWGAKLKYAGFDGLIVEGKSDKLVYINIEDDKIEILPADEYAGMLSDKLDETMKEKYPKCSVLSIGPAGENQSLLAAIMNDRDRAAGRSGVGAVMGRLMEFALHHVSAKSLFFLSLCSSVSADLFFSHLSFLFLLSCSTTFLLSIVRFFWSL